MIRVLLLVLLVALIGGLAYLALTPPTYRPVQVSQPVTLPNAAAPR